ncbi:MAG: hypothetical protein ACOCQX_02230 [Candidatus Nanoarchaeia archaeon]
MNDIDAVIKRLMRETVLFVPNNTDSEKYQKPSLSNLKKTHKEFADLKNTFEECFCEYLNGIYVDSEKFLYFNSDIEDLENIFPDMKLKMLDDLSFPKGAFGNISWIAEILYKETDTLSCLDYLVKESEKQAYTDLNEYSINAIQEELGNAEGKIEEIYDQVIHAYKNSRDTDNILKQYYKTISDYGAVNFKNKILEYMKKEYGYDNIAESLENIDSFEEISNKLRKATIDDLPLSDAYYETKKKILHGKATEEDITILRKIEIESKEMKNELKQFASFFKPDLSHYENIQKACRQFLEKVNYPYTEGKI